MFKKSHKTKQFDLFFSPSGMICDRESRLYDDASAWYNAFYQNVTSKIKEDLFKPLYKEDNVGAPNASIRILLAMSILKETLQALARYTWINMRRLFLFDIKLQTQIA